MQKSAHEAVMSKLYLLHFVEHILADRPWDKILLHTRIFVNTVTSFIEYLSSLVSPHVISS